MVSGRMACGPAGLSTSAYRRPLNGQTTADPDRALRDWLRAYAKRHPRWGYRRAYHDDRGEGWGGRMLAHRPDLTKGRPTPSGGRERTQRPTSKCA